MRKKQKENDRILQALKSLVGTRRYLFHNRTHIKISRLFEGSEYEHYFSYYKLKGDRRQIRIENSQALLEMSREY